MAFYTDRVTVTATPRESSYNRQARLKGSEPVSTAPAPTEPRSSARERLLAAANELFYAEGVQTVGIDRIIERAGVAKASLYNLFGSKEGAGGRLPGLTTRRDDQQAHRGDRERRRSAAENPGVFEAQAQQYQQPDFNGCAFIAASTEAPSGGLVEQAADQFRAWIRAMFTELADQAGAPDPVCLGASSISSTTAPDWRAGWTTTTLGSHLPPATPFRPCSTPR